MRFNAIALLAGAVMLGACGGGDNKADTTATTVDTAATASTTTPPATGATTAAAPAAGAAAPAPATGKTHTVNMVMEGTTYKFVPADLTVKQGDAVKFVMVSGGPHNVAFDAATLPAGAQAQLNANIPEKVADLASKMVMNPNEEITISFANVPAGKYPFVCQPHAAMGMKGTITVE